MEPVFTYAALVACAWAFYFFERWSARRAKNAALPASMGNMERLTDLKIKMITYGVTFAELKQLESELAGEGAAK